MKTLSYLNYSGIPYQAWSKCDDVIWVILQKMMHCGNVINVPYWHMNVVV